MGKRRNKRGPEEAAVGLVVLFAVYLSVRYSLQVFSVLKVMVILGGLALFVLMGFWFWRARRRKADWSQATALRPRSGFAAAPLEQSVMPAAGASSPARMGAVAVRGGKPLLLVARSVQPVAWSVPLIRELEWKRFEALCQGYWQAKGYRAELTGAGADGGIDINLYRPTVPDQLLAIIQCKSRAQDNIGVAVVRELFGVMHHVGAPMGILVTSTGFYPAARAFAAGKHLQLVDGETLCRQLNELPRAESQQLLAQITQGDYITPTCPKCEVKMVKRAGKTDGEGFYGCRNFPRGCWQTFPLRRVH